jgi:hypothetical protein
MARNVRQQLSRPRHVLASVALLVLLGGGGSILAIAAAGSQDGEGGGAVVLAAPLAGDRGVYELAAAEGSTLAEAERVTWDRAFAFHWLPDQVVAERDGRSQWGNMVALNTTYVASGGLDWRDDLLALVPGTSQGLARIHAENRTQRNEDGTTTYYVYAAQEFRDMSVVVDAEGDPIASEPLPCGFRPPFAGQALEPGDRFPVEAMCVWGPGPRTDSERVFLVRETGAANGTAYAQVDMVDLWHGGGGEREIPVLRLWYRADVPYPLRAESATYGYAFQLTHFERGSEAVREQSEPVRTQPAPEARFVKKGSWGGPDEAGIEHPYPMSEAILRARTDPAFPALRDFLASHPDAYVARAQFRVTESNGPERGSAMWWLSFTDGVEELSIIAIKEGAGAPLVPAAVRDLLPASSYRHYDYAVSDAVGLYPKPHKVPAAMPSVASMWDAWRAFASPAYADKEPNSWGLYIACYRTCDELDLRFDAGYTLYNRTYSGAGPLPGIFGFTGEPLDGEVSSTLEWWHLDGRDDYTFDGPMRYAESRVDWRREGQPPPEMQGLDLQDRPSQALALGFWGVPGPQAAAIGGLSFLATLVYWLWPAIKAGPAALFSRVRGEDLLRNALRAEIHQRIEAEPGIHHQALVRAVGRGHGAVEHHVAKLVAAGFVSRVQGKGYTCYFSKGTVDYRTMAAAPVLKSPVARSIVETVRRSPGIRAADLARTVGVSPATVHYHVERLRSAGVVRGELQAGALRLQPAEAA